MAGLLTAGDVAAPLAGTDTDQLRAEQAKHTRVQASRASPSVLCISFAISSKRDCW